MRRVGPSYTSTTAVVAWLGNWARGAGHSDALCIVVIDTEKGNAIGIEKGNTVAKPLQGTLWSPKGVKDAHGGRLLTDPTGPA